MSDNVVQFAKPEPERLIWACACGCTTHYHHASGDVECAACEAISTSVSGEWREHFPEAPEEPKPCDASSFKITNIGSPEVALKRFTKQLSVDDTAVAILIDNEGGLSTWIGDYMTPERQLWARERIADATERLMREAAKGDPNG